MRKVIGLRICIILLASAALLLPDHALAQNKPIHVDITGRKGGRLYGDITNAGDGFVFNGTLDVVVNSSRPESRVQLFLDLYKDKKKVQTVYIPVKGNNGRYNIENFKFEAKSPFDHVGWRTQYNYKLD